MKHSELTISLVFLCFIYTIPLISSTTTSEFLALVQGNWSFSELPSSTWEERRYKCNRKMQFSCDCKTASNSYDIGYKENVHPFCLENPTHGSCTGGCLDVFNTNFISDYSTQGACEAVQRTWTPPLRPKCMQQNGNDIYNVATCQSKTNCEGSCASLENCVDGNNNVCTQAVWQDIVADTVVCTTYGLGAAPCTITPESGIDGKCELAGADVSATYSTEANCLSPMTFIPALSITNTYYEMSKYNSGTSTFTENDNRQCAAGTETQAKLGGSKECPFEDSFCNRYPKIDRVDIDNDNYNQFLLHSSFTVIGSLKQCDYLGALDTGTGLYDAQTYPLAPCPDRTNPYYCDFPQNELFGHPNVSDTTCGVGSYNNVSRNDVGLPHGIREWNNGYSKQAWQWSVEMEDPVSAASAMNTVMTEMESVQMNIFSIGKLVDKKYILTSHREGVDEGKVNDEIALELNDFFRLLAKTGDAVTISDLKTEAEVHAAAEWSPSDVDEDGLVSKLRCHSVPDTKIDDFRQVVDVRKDFIDKFFDANTQEDCSHGQAALDNEARSFERCDNSDDSASFLYPSTRKAFFNPVTSDGYLSGFTKGQRFIKEMARSTDNIGTVEAGLRTMPDGTEVHQNATYQHIKFMMAMSTNQLEQCNTVRGHCRNLWYQFPRKSYATAASALLQTYTDVNHTSVEGCKLACIGDSSCGGFEIIVGRECKLKAAAGARSNGGGDYTDLRMEVQETAGVTAYYLERPNCEFRILGTRAYDAKDDGIDGRWGVSYDQKGGERWGYQTCRTSITVKKLEKIDKDDVANGVYNDVGEDFIKEYPYTILIQDEDCIDATIEMEESVAQDTSAMVSLSEAQEVVKITATSTPDWCKTDNGHYTGEQMQSQDGGICLSHKQAYRSDIITDTSPYDVLISKQPQCLDATGTDVITTYATKYTCLKAAEDAGEAWVWKEAVNLEHNGREAKCVEVVTAADKTACEAAAGLTSYDFYTHECTRYHVMTETECGTAGHRWEPEKLATGTMAYITEKAFTAFKNNELTQDDLAATLKYEDERLTCSDLGTIPQSTGTQRSKYDRVRLVLWVDVLRLKDLYNEGKGASSIISRGLPVGLTEGYDANCKDCEVREVGQHKLESSDQDVIYYNEVTGQACSQALLGGDCKEYSFAEGYRSSGIGDTFRGRTQAERDARNQIRQVVGKYLVRDVGLDEAAGLGQAFWNDDLTTISYLGTATTSVKPLEESVQDLRENFGDSKIYSRYMVELFSDCLDRTRVQEHSSRLEFQIFKEGRLHGDRLRDALPELTGGQWNAGMTKFDVTAEEADALVTTTATAKDIRTGDLVTLSGCSTAADDANYYVSGTSEVAEVTTSVTYSIDATPKRRFTDASTSIDCTTEADAAAKLSCCQAAATAAGSIGFYLYDTGDCEIYSTMTTDTSFTDGNLYVQQSTSTPTGNYVVKATLAAFPTEPRAVGAPLTGKTFSSGCKIAQKERDCDGYSFDIRTDALLAKASPRYDSFQIDTRDICGPVELDSTSCTLNEPTSCNYLKPCGGTIPENIRDDFGWPATCTTPSGARCQICNIDTPQCYDGFGTNKPDGALVGHTMHEDMQCAGYDYTNPDIKLGITVKQIVAGDESIDNLDFIDIPVEQQTYGNIYGAELLEFSVGLRLMDTIDYEQDEYLTLKGIGSRTEVIAWLKNNRIGETYSLSDVRSLGDLTFPQLTTEEVIFTVQSYDREHDPNNFNVNIESLSICSHQPPAYFEPFIASGSINRNLVNCLTGQPNAGVDAFGQALPATGFDSLATSPVDSDPCEYVYNTCPHKSGTGYTMKREVDDYFLLADYRPLFGADGHLFMRETCDMISLSRHLDLLSLPDMGHPEDNDLVYINARNTPTQTVDNTVVAGSGRHAVEAACINPPAATALGPTAIQFYKPLGPQGQQIPVSQTLVRNFKSMAIEDAKNLERSIREVIPCRRLATHGDDLTPEFTNAVLYGYGDSRSYGSLTEYGDNFEPKSCWRDGYVTSCREPHTDVDRTSALNTADLCLGPTTTKPRSRVGLIPHKCENMIPGNIIGTGAEVQVDGVTVSTKDECWHQCKAQHYVKCIFMSATNECRGDNANQGNIQTLVPDGTSADYITNCSARTYDIAASAAGQFKGVTTALFNASTAADLEEAESICALDANCIGFQEKAGAATALKCATDAATDLTTDVDVLTSFPTLYKGSFDSCLATCVEKSPTSDVVEHSSTACICKTVTVAGTCDANAANAVPDHFIVPGKLGEAARAVTYEFFEQVDPDELGEEEVYSTRHMKVTEHNCQWCKWSNTVPRVHDNDSENCMTSVAGHLSSATSFQTYMDNIGGSVNFEEEVCVQKNNLWRESGTKHLPCRYRSLHDFKVDSVYEPVGWVLTDEEKAYRLSPNSPSWDAIQFSPDDVGNIADHWEPVTKDFILPIKAEIVIHGSSCIADYDTTSGDSVSNGRRRLLGNKQRIHFGFNKKKRTLLQFDDADAMTPVQEFGGTTSSAFNIAISVTAENVAAQKVLGPNGQILKPGDPLYPIADKDADGDLQDDIYETVHKMHQADINCMGTLNTMWFGIAFGLYYGTLFLLSLILVNVPDTITGKPMNIFFDVLAE